MLATAIIVFREVLEAVLVVGIVMAAVRGVPGRNRWISLGVAAGIAGALVVAWFAEAISNAAAGLGQELFNAIVLFLAVAMLGWHVAWMSRHGRKMAADLNAVGAAVRAGETTLAVLAGVVAVAILREGSEIVLFLAGIVAGGATDNAGLLAGGAAGLAGGIAVGCLLYLGLIRIPGRYLFSVTNWMILLLAAGMAAKGANFLVQAGWLPALGENLWDTSALISDGSIVGTSLNALVGYVAEPSGIQAIFYVATVVVIGSLMLLLTPSTRPPARGATAAPEAGVPEAPSRAA
jgi:high-affinity iron transporter